MGERLVTRNLLSATRTGAPLTRYLLFSSGISSAPHVRQMRAAGRLQWTRLTRPRLQHTTLGGHMPLHIHQHPGGTHAITHTPPPWGDTCHYTYTTTLGGHMPLHTPPPWGVTCHYTYTTTLGGHMPLHIHHLLHHSGGALQ